MVCKELHSLPPKRTTPLEKCRDYGVALFLPRAPTPLAAWQFTGEKGKGGKGTIGTFLL